MGVPQFPIPTEIKCEHCGKGTSIQGDVCSWCDKPTVTARNRHLATWWGSLGGFVGGLLVGGPIGGVIGCVVLGGATAAIAEKISPAKKK